MIAFWILAVLLVVSALAVVFLKNPMYSALALIFNMLAIAGLFALLEAHFLAAVQIIVYAGAVMVLVLFVLMLLNTKEEDTKEHSPLVIGAASGVSILIIIVSAPLLLEAFSRFPSPSENFSGSMKDLGLILYTRYILPFEAASVLIMVAVAGAVMLAKRRFR